MNIESQATSLVVAFNADSYEIPQDGVVFRLLFINPNWVWDLPIDVVYEPRKTLREMSLAHYKDTKFGGPQLIRAMICFDILTDEIVTRLGLDVTAHERTETLRDFELKLDNLN